MTLESYRKYLGTFHAEIDAIILDRGNGGLGNPGKGGQLTLAEFLKLAQDADGFSDRDVHSLPGWTKLAHVIASDSREGSPG